MELIRITNRQISREPVIMPFNEREFLYKLKRIKGDIDINGKKQDKIAIRQLIKNTQILFGLPNIEAIPRKNFQEKNYWKIR